MARSCAGIISVPVPGTAAAPVRRARRDALRVALRSRSCHPLDDLVRIVPAEGGRRSQRVQAPRRRGYDGHMGILITVLVILAIVALVLFIVRRGRV